MKPMVRPTPAPVSAPILPAERRARGKFDCQRIAPIAYGRIDATGLKQQRGILTSLCHSNALGFFDSRDLRGMNVINTYFCRR